MEVRGILLALEDEKNSQNLSRAKMKVQEKKIGELKAKVKDERETILTAAAKMFQVEAKIETKIKALEDFARVNAFFGDFFYYCPLKAVPSFRSAKA